MSRTPLIYSRAYDSGELRTRILKPGMAEVTVRGWKDIPDLQIISLKAGITTVLRLAGRKDIKVVPERRPTGVLYIATWRA